MSRIQGGGIYAGTQYRLFRENDYFYYQIYPWHIYPGNINPNEYPMEYSNERYHSLHDAEETCKRKIEYLIDEYHKNK